MSDIIRVKCLKVNKFRRLENVDIPIGPEITILAGQNGTGKSTILGMLAQPFSFGVLTGATARTEDNSAYIDTYHGLKLHEFVDYADRSFMYNCDDVFRLSQEFDFGKTYEYTTELSLPKDATLPNRRLLTKSRPRRNKAGDLTGLRFVTGPGPSHGSGEGNFPHPVIYLGLNRLWPLAITKECSFLQDDPSEEDQDWFVKKYDEVLCLNEANNDARYMNASVKQVFLTPRSDDYNGESCSAGQDNLSQILTAILSFRQLKVELKEKYRGGLLLIDEVDATFHAFAQDRLLELLRDACEELDIQIVVTSHSLRLLENVFHSKLKKHVKLLYFTNIDGRTDRLDFKTYQEVSDHLKVETTRAIAKKSSKVSVLLEDAVARQLFHRICGSKLRNYIKVLDKSSSGGSLKVLADMSAKVPEIGRLLLVADGDIAKDLSAPPKNLLFLPGEKVRPETLLYRHLFDMKEGDPFWKSCGSTYNRSVAITRHRVKRESGNDKSWVKKWYSEQSKHWGQGGKLALDSWTQAHKAECKEFSRKFIRLLSARIPGGLPKEVEKNVLDQFAGD